jgi:DNA polymerase-1
MEKVGIRLDTAALNELASEMSARQAVIEAEIYELAGGKLNIGSPSQLREVLFGRLGLSTRGVKRGKTGLSTDADVLSRLANQHPLPAKILEFRNLTKLRSTYVEALPAAVDPHTGRLHTTFNQTVAATGRLSSSNPNLQNIPTRGELGQRIRGAFIAAEGSRLVVADYSQIELRILAHLSQDAVLLDSFHRGEDIHARTAAEIFGVLPGTVSRDMRRTAKVINFGVLYGMGAQALSRELGIPVAAAESYIRSYFERYSGVRDYLETARKNAHAQGFVTTLLGRRRTLPDLASRDRNLVQAAERIAVNTPIQGSAADLMKLAMVRVDRRLRGLTGRASMILQVHDELVVEAETDLCDAVRDLLREEMEGAMALRVPLVVDVGVGESWVDAH